MSTLLNHKAKLITVIKLVQDSKLNDIHHMIKLGFLHSTQSRTEDKPHNKQDNTRVPEVHKPNVKSVWGCAVEIRSLSGPAQFSALTAPDVQAVKDLDSVQRSFGQTFRSSCLF